MLGCSLTLVLSYSLCAGHWKKKHTLKMMVLGQAQLVLNMWLFGKVCVCSGLAMHCLLLLRLCPVWLAVSGCVLILLAR